GEPEVAEGLIDFEPPAVAENRAGRAEERVVVHQRGVARRERHAGRHREILLDVVHDLAGAQIVPSRSELMGISDLLNAGRELDTFRAVERIRHNAAELTVGLLNTLD